MLIQKGQFFIASVGAYSQQCDYGTILQSFTDAEMRLCDMCVSARQEEGHAMFAFVFL